MRAAALAQLEPQRGSGQGGRSLLERISRPHRRTALEEFPLENSGRHRPLPRRPFEGRCTLDQSVAASAPARSARPIPEGADLRGHSHSDTDAARVRRDRHSACFRLTRDSNSAKTAAHPVVAVAAECPFQVPFLFDFLSEDLSPCRTTQSGAGAHAWGRCRRFTQQSLPLLARGGCGGLRRRARRAACASFATPLRRRAARTGLQKQTGRHQDLPGRADRQRPQSPAAVAQLVVRRGARRAAQWPAGQARRRFAHPRRDGPCPCSRRSTRLAEFGKDRAGPERRHRARPDRQRNQHLHEREFASAPRATEAPDRPQC